jgi:TonB family protein
MNTFLFMLTEASVAMALFYLVYWFFLRKETCFRANRFYLTGALLLSVILPLFPLRYTVWVVPGEPTVFEAMSEAFHQIRPVAGQQGHTVSGTASVQWWLMVYLAGTFFLLGRLFLQTLILVRMILGSVEESQSRSGKSGLVENSRYAVPFSFFRYIFINPAVQSGSDLNDIIAHEEVHIREHHWIDLVIAEILTAVFWFNPFVWWFGRSIRQNHEYLADEGVLAQGRNLGRYQALLINQLLGVQVVGITNHLNFSLNETRLKMMTKNKESKFRAIRLAWALPVVAALLVAFAEPVYQQLPANNSDLESLPVTGLQGEQKISGIVYAPDGKPLHGAAVVLGGTTTGTMTDVDGRFSLQVPIRTGNVLYISFVGYETAQVRADGPDKELNVTVNMKEGVFHIDPDKHFVAPPPPPPPPIPSSGAKAPGAGDDEVFIVVEQMPQYPGGFGELGKYVGNRVKELKETAFFEGKELKGNALIGFTVAADGKVTGIKVLESDNQPAANAAVELARGMAVWTPGMQRGKAVPANFTLPVRF